MAPRWSHTGRELFFVNAARDLIAAEVRTAPSFTIVRQTRLFSTDGYVVAILSQGWPNHPAGIEAVERVNQWVAASLT